jgi:hypothetical protein
LPAFVPRKSLGRGPAEFGDAGHPWEGHELDVVDVLERLAPRRSLGSEDRLFGDADSPGPRVPLVRVPDTGVSGPEEAELRVVVSTSCLCRPSRPET